MVDNLATFMRQLSSNLRASTSWWNHQEPYKDLNINNTENQLDATTTVY